MGLLQIRQQYFFLPGALADVVAVVAVAAAVVVATVAAVEAVGVALLVETFFRCLH